MNSSRPVAGRISPDRWPTEMPLFVATIVVALVVWLLLIISVFGLLYAGAIALFFFVSHVAFVAYIRGSGVRLGPDQFPELHRRVEDLAKAMDLEPPAAYLLQAGGSLNAFATRFLGRNIVVLYSDLLEACGDNDGARDMIVAHELAHLRCGHLRWTWLTLPGCFVPFLGGALSRAREYTCDRFGLAAAGDAASAALGLAVLSAGPAFGPQVNLRAFVNQQHDLNTGFMTLGEWLSTHPPLSKRVSVLEPSLLDGRLEPGKGRILAAAIIALAVLGGGGLTVAGVALASRFMPATPEAAGPGGPAEVSLLDPAANPGQGVIGDAMEGPSADTDVYRGVLAAGDGDWDAARQHATRAIARDALHVDARRLLARVCFEQKDYACALSEAHRAIELRPDAGILHEVLAMALLGNGQEEEALAELRVAVRLEPSLEHAWLTRARLAHGLDLWSETDSSYAALQRLNPEALTGSDEDRAMWASARLAR